MFFGSLPPLIYFSQLVYRLTTSFYHRSTLYRYWFNDSVILLSPAKKKLVKRKGKGRVFSTSIRKMLLLYALMQQFCMCDDRVSISFPGRVLFHHLARPLLCFLHCIKFYSTQNFIFLLQTLLQFSFLTPCYPSALSYSLTCPGKIQNLLDSELFITRDYNKSQLHKPILYKNPQTYYCFNLT